ncbi:MAG TPA: M1 family peptidase, partial [Allosphingosinicella sp.]
MRPMSFVSTLALATTLAVLPGLAGAATTAPPSAAPQTVAEVPTQLPRTVRPTHYAISVVPDPANLRFTGSVSIDINVLQPTDTITLTAAELDFTSATLSGAAGAPVRATALTTDA